MDQGGEDWSPSASVAVRATLLTRSQSGPALDSDSLKAFVHTDVYVHRHTEVLLTTAKHTAVFPSSPGDFLFFFSAAFPNQHVDPEAGETKPSRGSAELCVGHPTDAARRTNL